MLDLTNPKTIRQLLADNHLTTKKYLGQHFLLSHRVLAEIIKTADLNAEDTVLEIGPGLGTLTLELTKHVKQVIAVEKDEKLCEVLKRNLEIEKLRNKVEIVNEDILKFSIFNFQFSDPKYQILNSKFKIIANLPYQITSPLLWKFLHGDAEQHSKTPPYFPPSQGRDRRPKLMVIMIQKEVAERLMAKPGKMSLLSVLAQYYAKVSAVMQVKRTLFYPPPKINSTVIKLETRNKKLETRVNEKEFFKLVKFGFASKRKQLKNNLKSLFTDRDISRALKQAGLPATTRAQELSVDQWIKLYEMLYNS